MGSGKKKASAASPEVVKTAVAQATGRLVTRITEMTEALEAQREASDALARRVVDLKFEADAASGVINPNDPGQREAGWQTAYKRFKTDAEPGRAAYLRHIARYDLDPGQRETAWQELYAMKVSGEAL